VTNEIARTTREMHWTLIRLNAKHAGSVSRAITYAYTQILRRRKMRRLRRQTTAKKSVDEART